METCKTLQYRTHSVEMLKRINNTAVLKRLSLCVRRLAHALQLVFHSLRKFVQLGFHCWLVQHNGLVTGVW